MTEQLTATYPTHMTPSPGMQMTRLTAFSKRTKGTAPARTRSSTGKPSAALSWKAGAPGSTYGKQLYALLLTPPPCKRERTLMPTLLLKVLHTIERFCDVSLQAARLQQLCCAPCSLSDGGAYNCAVALFVEAGNNDVLCTLPIGLARIGHRKRYICDTS